MQRRSLTLLALTSPNACAGLRPGPVADLPRQAGLRAEMAPIQPRRVEIRFAP